MNEMKIFNTKEDMFNEIIINWKGFIFYEDLSISEDYEKDNRIDWKKIRYTSLYWNVLYRRLMKPSFLVGWI